MVSTLSRALQAAEAWHHSRPSGWVTDTREHSVQGQGHLRTPVALLGILWHAPGSVWPRGQPPSDHSPQQP